ncbi:MAG TPA: hypothetical protein VIH52_00770 [Candidatus Nanoarchaeia archaeon]
MVEQVNAQKLGQIDAGQLGVPTEAGAVISALIQLALAAAGLLFFGMLVLGGLKYLTAGGDEKAAASARATLTHALMGLIIIVAAFLLAQLLFSLFGLEGIINFQ